MPPAERLPGDRHEDGHGRHGAFRIALAVVAAAYALAAATTTPFTTAANLLTGIPIVVMAVLVVIRWPLHPRPLTLAPERSHPWRAWVVLFAVLAAWELVEYTARGSRADHPTESSMLNAVDRTDVLKAVVVFVWLWLGAAIIRDGRRRPTPNEDNRGQGGAR